MKKIIAANVIIAVLTVLGTVAFADNTIPTNVIDIYVNGRVIENYYDNQRAFFDTNGRTQVPLRTLAEAMGFTVGYENKTQKVTIDDNIILQINSDKVQTPTGTITMDTKAVTINDRTYVPIRFVAEALGWKVGYKQLTDNSGASAGRATHMVTVDKEGTVPDTGTTVTDGIVTNGVLKYSSNVDMTKNAYLIDFMEKNFGEDSYYIGKAGAAYAAFGMQGTKTTGRATIFGAVDEDNGYWYIEVKNFNQGERSVMQASLKTITGDADTIYSKFVEMWDGSATREEAAEKYGFESWKTAGSTQYMFNLSQSGRISLRIKY